MLIESYLKYANNTTYTATKAKATLWILKKKENLILKKYLQIFTFY